MMMRSAALVALLAAAAVCVARAEIAEDKDGVLVLTDDTFDAAIEEQDTLLVEFYAPWCGHCKSLQGPYGAAAKKLAEHDPPLRLAKVDATENREVSDRFGVRGYPTLKFFRGGQPVDYDGGRTENEIVSWVTKKSGPPAKTIASADEVSAMQESSDVVVVGIFGDAEGENAKKFMKAAGASDAAAFAITTEAAVRSHYSVGDGDAIVLLKPFDEERNDLSVTDDISADDIGAFVSTNSLPLVSEFTQEASQRIFGNEVKVHLLVFTDKEADHHEPTMEAVRGVAREYRGRALMVNVPSTEKRVVDYFSLSADDFPVAILADMRQEGQMRKFFYEGEGVDTDGVNRFLGDFFEGKIKPSLKSEEPEEDDTTGPVTTLRGKTFDDIVVNNDKDVLVEFYAPWCGHCKKLAPIWAELGEKFADVDTVTIAQMDATANEVDVEGVNVRGFPTIYFFKGNDKENPIAYSGGRELDDLVSYLKTAASTSFTLDGDSEEKTEL